MAEAAGLAIGAVSLGIQLADGARKAFVFLEKAVHAGDTCKSFACNLAIEHQRLNAWVDITGLDDESLLEAAENGQADPKREAATAKAASQFAKLAKYCGPAIISILSEIHVIMTQLSEKEGKYSQLIDVTEDAGLTRTESVDSLVEETEHTADLTDPRPTAPSKREQMARLGTAIVSTVPKLASTGARQRNLKPASKTSRREIIERLTKSRRELMSEPRRYIWILKDEPACNAKLVRLQRLNDFLEEALDRHQRNDLIESTEQFRLMVVQFHSDLSTKLGHLTAIVSASSMAHDNATLSGSTLVESSTALPHPSSAGSSYIQRAARFVLDVYQASPVNARLGVQTQKELEGVSLNDLGCARSLVMPGPDRLLFIEWKAYTLIQQTIDGLPDIAIDQAVVTRMDSLVSLLKVPTKPQEFCVPSCLGYFDDVKRQSFGVVYQSPNGRKPSSLLDYFAIENVALSARIDIGRRLSEWLLYLHSVRWLHKGICSSNVLFFSNSDSQDFGRPFITGFDHSRTSMTSGQITTKPPEDADQNLYVHPDYLGPKQIDGYRKVYDIYSLGIVLIELAYWKPIRSLVGSFKRRVQQSQGRNVPHSDAASISISAEDAKELRGKILDGRWDVLAGVKAAMGNKYHDAVKACLLGPAGFGLDENADESNGHTSNDLLEAFSDIVVSPLRHIDV